MLTFPLRHSTSCTTCDAEEEPYRGFVDGDGIPYNKQRLHRKAYIHELLGSLGHMPDAVRRLLTLSRGQVELLEGIQKQLLWKGARGRS